MGLAGRSTRPLDKCRSVQGDLNESIRVFMDGSGSPARWFGWFIRLVRVVMPVNPGPARRNPSQKS